MVDGLERTRAAVDVYVVTELLLTLELPLVNVVS